MLNEEVVRELQQKKHVYQNDTASSKDEENRSVKDSLKDEYSIPANWQKHILSPFYTNALIKNIQIRQFLNIQDLQEIKTIKHRKLHLGSHSLKKNSIRMKSIISYRKASKRLSIYRFNQIEFNDKIKEEGKDLFIILKRKWRINVQHLTFHYLFSILIRVVKLY